MRHVSVHNACCFLWINFFDAPEIDMFETYVTHNTKIGLIK